MNCVDRVFLLSHPKYDKENLKRIIRTFLDNDYPVKFIIYIFDTINLRLKSLFKRKTLKQSEKSNHMTNDKEKISWFTIPFLPVIYEKFKKITKDLNVKIAFFSLNKLNRFVKAEKDVLAHNSNKKRCL